jgi:hypothetical protein
MKAIKSISLLTILLLIHSCGDKEKVAEKKEQLNPRATRSFEIVDGDTVNVTDVSNRRQGHWKIKQPVACTKTIQAIYTGEPGVQTKIISDDKDWVKLEEGDYVDGKREGPWKFYYPSGKIKDSTVYKNDIAIK